MAPDLRDGTHHWQRLLDPVFDLLAAVGLTVGCAVVVSNPASFGRPVRILTGLPLLFFLPGYALIAALFPSRNVLAAAESDADEEPLSVVGGLEPLTRVALSVLGSVAVAALAGFALNFTPWGIRLVSVVAALAGTTVLAAFVGAHRRLRLPSDRRYSPSVRRTLALAGPDLSRSESGGVSLFHVLVALSVLAALSTAAYSVAVPERGEKFTEFYLLGENGNGQAVADGYPTEFGPGERRSVVVGIENGERRATNYSVVVQTQRIQSENGANAVVERARTAQFRTTLSPNEMARREVELAPALRGPDLRLTFLLYRGSAPPNPSAETAYRTTHLSINATDSARAAQESDVRRRGALAA